MASAKKSPSRLGWRVPASALLFLVIPILFVFAVSQLTKAKGPQWLPQTFENPYAYLFNSLLLVDGRTPQYVDHPGILGLAIGLVPIYLHVLRLATWAFKIGIHSEEYGNGPVGLPPAGAYLESVRLLLSDGPLFVIIPTVTVAAVLGLTLFTKKDKPPGTVSWRLVLPPVRCTTGLFPGRRKMPGHPVFNSALVERRP